MHVKNSTHSYGAISIGFHWLMFILLVLVYACIELREIYPKGSDPREALKFWHFSFGLTIFCLVWLRLITRLVQVTPMITPQPERWMIYASKVSHVLLYVLMIAMPIGGWFILSAEGKTIPFYGLSLPAITGENKAAAELVEEIHETVGLVGYFLIGLHTFAALFHHYIKKDNTLKRMIPK